LKKWKYLKNAKFFKDNSDVEIKSFIGVVESIVKEII